MLTLQEMFRQLALDMNAVSADDPELPKFNVVIDKTPVDVHFRDYKKDLRIRAEVYVEGRPRFVITTRGPIDRLGQRLGTDERQILADDDFNARYEMTIAESDDVDHLSARDAVSAMFSDAPARDAVHALAKDGVLPVSISSSGVEWGREPCSRGDLELARVQKIAAGTAALARALPDARVTGPNRAPIPDGMGRKLIRRVKTESFAHKVFASLDMWPMVLLIGGAGLTGAWFEGDTHFLDHRLWLLGVVFAAVAVLSGPAFLLALRGTNNALAYTLWRSIGVSSVLAGAVYCALFIYDAEADNARSVSEKVTILSVRQSLGPIPGATTFRTSRNETLHVLSDDLGKAGATAHVTLHPGKIGWRWVDKPRD